MPIRADEALVTAGMCSTIERARAIIMEGKAIYGTQKLNKPSEAIRHPELLRIKGDKSDYVSRGAYKLKRAFELFHISAKDKNCIDVGASTGGFTDVMLRKGAKQVFCIDVGYNLLDWKIRSDPRVTVMEKTNARFLRPEMFSEPITFGATDVSFISLKAILPAVFLVLQPFSDFIALVKPQFEAEKSEVGEKGVVRERGTHIKVLHDICGYLHTENLSVYGIGYSPIKGPEGNIEFLLYIRNDGAGTVLPDGSIADTVDQAHEVLC